MSGKHQRAPRHHDTVTDAGMRAWICEKGHVDDHHYDNEPQRCSRCGGRCTRIVLDGLAAHHAKALRQLAKLRSEIAYVRGHLEGYAAGAKVAMEPYLSHGDYEAPVEALEKLIPALREDAKRLNSAGESEES